MKILLTGGTGFFGGVLKGRLREAGHGCVNLDRLSDPEDTASGRMVVADVADAEAVESAFRQCGPFDTVCHVAAELAHEANDKERLWKSNVEGTRNIVQACLRHGVRKLIFTSTNCLWGRPLDRPIAENDAPCPVEIYGRSKLEAERILREQAAAMDIVIFRSGTILAPGRVGLLGILFDFFAENRRVPVVGRKNKPHQFIAAEDYAQAILLALERPGSDLFHVGSHHPTSLEQSYREVVRRSGSRSKIYHLPEFPTLLLMRLCHALKISPLGPYQYGMIAEQFVFDTSHVEKTLGWRPTKENGEILFDAYDFYIKNRRRLEEEAASLPAHRRKSRLGVIRLLKWIS